MTTGCGVNKLAILVSGSGTNMENLIKECQAGRISAEATVVISDRPGVAALDRAKKLNVPAIVVDRKQFSTKEDFENALSREIDDRKIDWILLAGFMRILSPQFVRRFKPSIINIHPSLLPAFPGAHGIRDAFEAKVKETGVTVHFVEEEVDAGPIILQRKVPIDPKDTLETLEAKIHAVEYKLYPEALRQIIGM